MAASSCSARGYEVAVVIVWRAKHRRWRLWSRRTLMGRELQLELGKLRVVFGRPKEVQ
jgi:hypothetical protein